MSQTLPCLLTSLTRGGQQFGVLPSKSEVEYAGKGSSLTIDDFLGLLSFKSARRTERIFGPNRHIPGPSCLGVLAGLPYTTEGSPARTPRQDDPSRYGHSGKRWIKDDTDM